MATMRGPLSTMVEVNRREQAKAELRVAASLVLVNSGDTCADVDSYTEGPDPAGAGPTGGGVLPAVGASQNDPWGNPYGYCAWDHGDIAANFDGCGTNILAGNTSTNNIAIAVVSAGPDGAFNTTCAADNAGTNDYVEPDGGGGDDIVVSMTYDQAVSGGGGLWTPVGITGATIARDVAITGGNTLDVSGTSTFQDVLSLTGATAQLQLGARSMLLPDETLAVDGECAVGADAGMLRYNTGSGFVEVCDGANFVNSGSPWGSNANGIDYAGGNIGIGVALPNDALDVSGSAQITGAVDFDTTLNVDGILTVNAASQLYGDTIIRGSTTGVTTVDALTVQDSASSVIFTVQNDGMVGINSADPNDQLDVNGAIDATDFYKLNNVAILDDGGAAATVLLGQNAGAAVTGDNNTLLGAGTGATLTTGTNNTLIGQGVDTPLAATADYLNIANVVQSSLANLTAPVATTAPVTAIGYTTAYDFVANADLLNDALEVRGSADISDDLNVTDALTVGGISDLGDNVTITGDTADGTTDPLTIKDSGSTTVLTVDSDGDITTNSTIYINDTENLDPGATCSAGSFNRWTGSAWTCSADTGGSGSGTQDFEDVLSNDNNANTLTALNLGGVAIGAAALTAGIELDVTGEAAVSGGLAIGSTTLTVGAEETLELDVTGDVGADNYCDAAGANCFTAASVANASQDRIEDTGDQNTYIDVDTADDDSLNTISMFTAGTERILIGATGTVAVTNAATVGGTLGVTGAATLDDDLIVDTDTLFVDDSADNVGIGTAAPNASASLDITSTTTGFLGPRMTIAQRDLIGTPATGLMIFATDAGTSGILQFYDGTAWVDVGAGGASGAGIWQEDGTNDYIEYDDTLGGVRIGKVTGQPAPETDWLLDVAGNVVYTTANTVAIGSGTVSDDAGGNLDVQLDLTGDIAATEYCDENGANCFTAATVSGGGGSTALSNITAAIADNTITNAAWNQLWQWQLTTTEAGISFGESVASAGGGANDQSIVYMGTLASSTAIPLTIENLGDGFSFLVTDSAADTTPFVIDEAGLVGINSLAPRALLDVDGGDFLVTGTFTAFTPSVPVTGAGARMFFDPDSASFRAGSVAGTEWDNAQIGDYSVAMGRETQATNSNSVALGYTANATGLSSVALGQQVDADGNFSIAMGHDATVTGAGVNSMAIGLGDATGTFPQVSAARSFGIFMGDQNNVDLNTTNTLLLAGGQLLIDPAVPATQLTARSVIDVGAATDSIVMPRGTNAQRPTGIDGMIRFNSENDAYEVYSTTAVDWIEIVSAGAVSGGVAGADTQVQFNDGGAPGADAGLTYNKTTDTLTIGTALNVGEVINITGQAGNAPIFAALNDLSDTSVAGPTDGDLLYYNNGTGNWETIAQSAISASPELSNIIAATADNVVDSAAWNQAWQWQLTGAEIGMQFSESVASTGGSSNQIILAATTLAGSTAIPFVIQNRGNDLSFVVEDVATDTTPFVIDEAGLVGIGRLAPRALLDVDGGDFIVSGTHSGIASVPVSGTGTRMFFDNEMSAFRAGWVNGTQWDNGNIGQYSFATGESTIASGSWSVAMGDAATASGGQAFSMGFLTNAAGDSSAAMGQEVATTAAADYSFAFGLGNAAGVAPQVSAPNSFGIFMGDQSAVDLATANTFGIFGGSIVIDPTVPATNLIADVALEIDGTIKIDDGGEACDANREGSIKYVPGSDTFFFCAAVANDWEAVSLGSGVTEINDLTDAITTYGGTTSMYLGEDGSSNVNGASAGTTPNNLAIGVAAGKSIATGGVGYLTLVGKNAGTAMTTGDSTVAVGANALMTNIIGTDIVAIGTQALEDSTSGFNVAVGDGALQKHTTGNSNVAIGYAAGREGAIAGRADNVFVGSQSGFENTGSNNVMIGRQAGLATASVDKTVSNSIFIGFEAGLVMEGTVDNGTFIGHQAGKANTSGANNTFLGHTAGGANVIGSDNAYFGNNAGSSETNSNNAFFGANAGTASAGGDDNAFFGTNAGANSGAGDDNLYMGYQAGTNASGNRNTALGSAAYDGAARTGDDNILIGYGVDTPLAGTSDYLSIGDTLYGDLATGRIGIGDATPDQTLDVVGAAASTNYILKVQNTTASGELILGTNHNDNSVFEVLTDATGNGYLRMRNNAQADANTFFWDSAQGRLGIGDITPDHTLDVNGNIGLSTSSYINWGNTDGSGGYGIRDNGGAIECKDSGGGWAACAGGGASAINDLTDAYTNYTTLNNFIMGRAGATALTAGAQFNTFIGELAGATSANSTATTDSNTAVGYSSGAALTTGASNVFLGYQAGLGVTAASDNVIIGTNAGDAALTSTKNVLIGNDSGTALTSGGNGTFIGEQAGFKTDTGADNTFVGKDAGWSNTGSGLNTYVGYRAGRSATGANNTLIGTRSGEDIIGGASNITLGQNAGATLTTGSSNILIGSASPPSAPGASSELNIGSTIYGNLTNDQIGLGVADASAINADAILELDSTTRGLLLPRMTTAQRDLINAGTPTAAGLTVYNTTTNTTDYWNGSAWVSFATGGGSVSEIDDLSDAAANYTLNNVYLGQGSGAATTTGAANVALGKNTLTTNTVGGGNTAIGNSALQLTDNGWGNTAVGEDAMLANTIGNGNVGLGQIALYKNTTGQWNTVTGASALLNNTTGEGNTASGYEAGGNDALADGDMDYNSLFGYRAGYNLTGGASGAGANNNILMGYQAGDVLTLGDSNIIIGHDVDPSGATVSNELNIGDTIYGDLANDYVGIGTNAPGATLELYKPTGSYPNLWFTAADVTMPVLSASSSLGDVSGKNTFGQIRHNKGQANNIVKGGMAVYGFTETGVNDWHPLHMVGMHGGATPTTASIVLTGQKWNGSTNRSALADGEIVLDVENKYDQSSAGNTVLMRIMGSGFVGIDGVTPGTALDVNGAFSMREMAAPALSPADEGRIYFDTTSNTFKVSENNGAYVDLVGGGSSLWTAGAGDDIYYNTGTPEVGIGTTTPVAALNIEGGDILIQGTFAAGVPSVPITGTSGTNSRLFFDTASAAFRAGQVDGTQWDDVNVGDYSFAMGDKVIASGDYSFAMGDNTNAVTFTQATGNHSLAFGPGALSTGLNSIAMGSNVSTTGVTQAIADHAVAIGLGSISSGAASFAMGTHANNTNVTKATANNAFAFGVGSAASGVGSFAMGTNTSTVVFTQATANNAFAFGASSNAAGVGSVAMGVSNGISDRTEALADYAVAFGRGSSAGTAPGTGDYSYVQGNDIDATANYAFARGSGATNASGLYSFANGLDTLADGDYSYALGRDINVSATGDYSVGFGLGNAAGGTDPIISGANSFGIFMGDQNGYNLTATNKMALIGGEFQIDDVGSSANKGCVRYNSATTKLQFSHDCAAYSDMGTGTVGGADTQVHFNNSGVEDGDAGLTYVPGTDTLNIGSTLNVTDLINIGSTTGAAAPTGGVTVSTSFALNDLTDAIITTPANTEVLTYNGTNWVNSASGGGGAINDLSDASTEYTTDFTLSLGSGAGASLAATGFFNTFVGINAGNAMTTGDNNVFIGLNAGLVSTADNGIFLGSEAGKANTTGDNNTFIGTNAGLASDTGEGNTYIGTSAGSKAVGTAADNNTFVGAFSGQENTSGDSNTYFGTSAGMNNTAGRYNTILGHGSGSTLNGTIAGQGDGNILIGYIVDVPTATTSDYLNIGNLIYGDIAAGEVFLDAPATAPGNADLANGQVTFWVDATNNEIEMKAKDSAGDVINATIGGGLWSDSGSGYIDYTSTLGGVKIAGITGAAAPSGAIGAGGAGGGAGAINDLSDGITGTTSVFLGNNAGASDDLTSNNNTAVGISALTNTTSGAGNTAIGKSALPTNVTGTNNTAMGYNSLFVNTGNENTAIGVNTLINNTTGYRNTAVGYYAGGVGAPADGDMDGNALFGYYAGANLTGGAAGAGANFNTIMGYSAGDTITTGDNNTVIGRDAGGTTLTTGSDNILIGRNADTAGAADSNKLNIGGTIYGDLSSDLVGIGQVPAAGVELDVLGDIEYTGTITDVSDRRLKKDIVPLSKYGALLEKIDQIDTYSFVMKDEKDARTEFGVMAQELEKIFPELVHTAQDEMGTKSVNYVGLIAPMIEATKALSAENKMLKADLASVKDGQDDIKATLASLSSQVELLNKTAGQKVGKASIAPLSNGWMYLLLGILSTLCIVLVVTRKPAKAN